MFEICDTILFNIDWFIDLNAVQEVLRAALFSEFNFRKYSGYPKTTNLGNLSILFCNNPFFAVIVHHRAKASDFEMARVRKRARMIKSMFKDSGYNVNGGLSMCNLGFTEYTDCEPDVNYVLLDDLPVWSKDREFMYAYVSVLNHRISAGHEPKLFRVPYDSMLTKLRPALVALKRHNFRYGLENLDIPTNSIF